MVADPSVVRFVRRFHGSSPDRHVARRHDAGIGEAFVIAALWEWVRTPVPSGRAYVALIIKAVVACLVWGVVFPLGFQAVCASESPTLNEAALKFYAQPKVVIALLLTCTVAVEELIRMAPLIVLLVFSRFRNARWAVITVAIAVSVWFGSQHTGNGPSLAFSVGMQGTCGLVFTMVFLKCGGISGRFFGMLVGFLAAYVTHLSFDLILLGLMACVG